MISTRKKAWEMVTIDTIRWWIISLCCIALATGEIHAQSFRLTVAAISGNFEFGPVSAPVEARARQGSTDITDKVTWSVQFTETRCGVPLLYKVGVITAGNPAKIDIYYNASRDAIPVGVYAYEIVAKRKSDGMVVTSSTYTFTIKPKTNEAPILNISRNIDTTLATGQTGIDYLEIIGTAEDACTDVISSIKWEQLEGPALSNYDAGNGKLVLQAAPIGTYVFRFSAQDDGGLSSDRVVNVYIRKKEIPELTTMKAFSPNEDGLDDEWKVENISISGNLYYVLIINQHGKMIFQANPPYINDVVWDGSNYGKLLPEGAYYYIITNKDKQEVKRGSVLLVR